MPSFEERFGYQVLLEIKHQERYKKDAESKMTNFSLSYNGKHTINLKKDSLSSPVCMQVNRGLGACLWISTLFFLGACSTPHTPKSNLQVFKNQKAQNNQTHYARAYLVRPDQDPHAVSDKLATALESQGIETHQYVSRDFFAPQGTGFFITESGYMLTCDHVLGYREKITFQSQGTEHSATVLFRDPITDLALLKTETMGPFIPIPISLQQHRLGDDLFALGFPLSGLLGIEPRLTKGIISAKVGFGDEPSRFQISAPIQPGNSGGPILNTQGAVIGIAQSTLNSDEVKAYAGGVPPQNVNFAITPKTISSFLSTAVEFGLFPQKQWNKLFNAQNSTPQLTSKNPTRNISLPFEVAETASVLISGSPQTKDEAIVIAIDYVPTTLENQLQQEQNLLLPEFILLESAKVLELPSLAFHTIFQSFSGQTTQFSSLFSPVQPIKSHAKQVDKRSLTPALSGFNVTLYDFRSKKPLFKMQQTSSAVESHTMVTESLRQMTNFFPLMNYPAKMEHVRADQNTIQAVAAEHVEQFPKPLTHANSTDPQH